MSTAFHPQSNGRTEKANDAVQKWLRAFAPGNSAKESNKALAGASFTEHLDVGLEGAPGWYRGGPNRTDAGGEQTTQNSPFFANFEKDPR